MSEKQMDELVEAVLRLTKTLRYIQGMCHRIAERGWVLYGRR